MTGRYQTSFGFEANPTQRDERRSANRPARRRARRSRIDPRKRRVRHRRSSASGTSAAHAKFHPLRRGFDEFFGFLHEGHYYVPPPWRGVTTLLRRATLPDGGQGRSLATVAVDVPHDQRQRGPDYDADNPLLRGGHAGSSKRNTSRPRSRARPCDFIGRHAHPARSSSTSPTTPCTARSRPPTPTSRSFMPTFRIIHRRIFAAHARAARRRRGHACSEKLHAPRPRAEHARRLPRRQRRSHPRAHIEQRPAPRRQRATVFEGGLRVPFLARWPARLPAGRVVDTPVISLDIAATVLAAAGVASEPGTLDGTDLSALLATPAGRRAHVLLAHGPAPRSAPRRLETRARRQPRPGRRLAAVQSRHRPR
jgi:arylsulfatase A-like enzyme